MRLVLVYDTQEENMPRLDSLLFDSKLLFHFIPSEVIHSSLFKESWSHQTLSTPPEGRRVFITKIVLSGTFSFCFLQICHEIDVTRWEEDEYALWNSFSASLTAAFCFDSLPDSVPLPPMRQNLFTTQVARFQRNGGQTPAAGGAKGAVVLRCSVF